MTRRCTYEKAARQREVGAALRSVGCMRIADRLERCAEVRLARRHGDGWPEVCRSAGCAWCGPTLARRWWAGIVRWIAQDGGPVSLFVVPLTRLPGSLRPSVVRLRRAVRDLRDRTARRDRRWRGVALAGMASACGEAFVLVRHAGVDRQEVEDVLRRR